MTDPEKRSRGRPRSSSVDTALAAAARDEFIAKGFKAMSMESIAQRAGVSKVSLYRRWTSKHAAIADVLGLMSETHALQDLGGLEADVLALVRATIESDQAKAAAKLLMRTMGEISEHPDLLALYRTHLLSPRIEQIRALIERARGRGEIDDTPTDVAAAIIAGPLFIHALAMLAEPKLQLPATLAESLTRSILSGIASKDRAIPPVQHQSP